MVLACATAAYAAWPYTSGGGPASWGLAVAVDPTNNRPVIAGALGGTIGVVKLSSGAAGGGPPVAKKDNYAGSGQANAVAIDDLSHVVVVGGQTVTAGDGVDFMVSRLNGALAEDWAPKRIKGSLSGGWDEAYDVAVNANRYAIAAGQVEDVSVALQLYVGKFDPANGNQVWSSPYRSGDAVGDDWAEAVALRSNRVAAAGTRGTSPSSFWVVDLIDNGTSQTFSWDYRCAISGGGIAYDVAFDGSGNVIAVGQSGTKFYAVKLSGTRSSSSGCTLGAGEWQSTDLTGVADNVAIDSAGDVYVAGKDAGGVMRLRKLSGSTGAAVWTRSITGASCPNQGCDVAVDASSNVVVSGIKNSNVYAREYTSGGAFTWDQEFTPGEGTGVALDTTGAAIVSGGDTSNGMVGAYHN